MLHLGETLSLRPDTLEYYEHECIKEERLSSQMSHNWVMDKEQEKNP